METLCLVIIEDEEAHFSLMKRAILKDLPNVSVHHFKDAGPCLKGLDEIAPDIIVTDYLMPGMNGIQFLEALNQEKRDIPVIMITGQGDEDIAVQAMKLGARDYLVKSADFFKLLSGIIEKVAREWKLKQSLRESEKRFQDLAENISDWIWEMDKRGRYIYCNPMVEGILGYRADEVVGKYFHDFFAESAKETLKESVFRVMTQKKPVSALETCLVHKAGHEIIVEVNGVPFFDKSGNLSGYRGVHRDISLRKRAKDHIRRLSHQLLRAQEIERQRISRDLHDHLAQDCSALKIGLDTLFAGQPDISIENRKKVSELSEMAHRTITAIRELAYNLSPAGLEQLGIVQTVLRYCEDFSGGGGPEVDFFSAGMDEVKLDFDTEITLYRLIQEGLNNIRRHADAARAAISLVASFPNIILRMEDNGKGFDIENRLEAAFNERRMGIRSMEERVALLNGKMSIDSRPMLGTKILVELPCRRENREQKEDSLDC
ncbi:MAG: PAS domain S-box protein [Deltaproteobacteria bacterium]|nr:PAS domain S-box protein [Deltaproteobacteria bacterium]